MAVLPAYDLSVFLNCPFDDGYRSLFHAAIFAVFDCGFLPRCALEISDSGQVRIEKIIKIITACRYGIHDISRTELDRDSQLPRFNMPLELGIFLGAQRFGVRKHRQKNCLVVDVDQYRYQKFISDISGQDISAHSGDPLRLIRIIRDWLRTASNVGHVPGGAEISRRFLRFDSELPEICSSMGLDRTELTFSDYTTLVSEWLRAQA